MFTTSLLLKNNNSILVASRLSLPSAHFSRRSNNKPFKVVKARINKLDDSSLENNVNWQLYPGSKNHRFYLPDCGPAWTNARSTISGPINLNELVDFESRDKQRLGISTKKCPLLLRKNLHEMFPAPEVIDNSNLTLITLVSRQIDDEKAAKNYVLAAREICSRLRLHGYFSDFINPFSGRPFYSYSSGKNLYKIDDRFRGFYIKLEENNSCMVISSEVKAKFSGNIFSNISPDLPFIKDLVLDED